MTQNSSLGPRRDRPVRPPLAPLLLLGLATAACDPLLPSAPPDEEVLAGPIAGLTQAQRARHLAGDAEFGRPFAAADGLGPIFVAASCESCHVGDGKGHPVFNLTRFGRPAPGGFDPMRELGGPQVQHRAVPGYVAEVVPEGATGVAVFTPPSVTGLGLLEAVEDAALLALQDPGDADGDGISGRVQLIGPGDVAGGTAPLDAFIARDPGARLAVAGSYIGRFGKKAGTVNLLHQVVMAYRDDMGITSDLVPADPVNLQVGHLAADAVADPEVGSGIVSDVAFYIRTLRPPPRREADAADVQVGQAAFAEIGCAKCHLPSLTTGPSSIAPLDRVTFHPYTDLLLHDMGPELDDGYTEGRALTSEWRTAPLWGIGLAQQSQGGRAFYLHDGRAGTLRAAIELHGGEAAASRSAFQALAADVQDRVLRFLGSL
jgi:CxxC motif-containing protein (DUF1111 family)